MSEDDLVEASLEGTFEDNVFRGSYEDVSIISAGSLWVDGSDSTG
jgi:hypothetical protein